MRLGVQFAKSSIRVGHSGEGCNESASGSNRFGNLNVKKNIFVRNNTYKEPDHFGVSVDHGYKFRVIARVAAKHIANHQGKIEGAQSEESVRKTQHSKNVQETGT